MFKQIKSKVNTQWIWLIKKTISSLIPSGRENKTTFWNVGQLGSWGVGKNNIPASISFPILYNASNTCFTQVRPLSEPLRKLFLFTPIIFIIEQLPNTPNIFWYLMNQLTFFFFCIDEFDTLTNHIEPWRRESKLSANFKKSESLNAAQT